jgi:hypothetical protein
LDDGESWLKNSLKNFLRFFVLADRPGAFRPYGSTGLAVFGAEKLFFILGVDMGGTQW